MGLRPHYLMDLVLGSGLLLQPLHACGYWRECLSGRRRIWTRFGISLFAVVVIAGVVLSPNRIAAHFPNSLVQWGRCIGMFLAVWTIYAYRSSCLTICEIQTQSQARLW